MLVTGQYAPAWLRSPRRRHASPLSHVASHCAQVSCLCTARDGLNDAEHSLDQFMVTGPALGQMLQSWPLGTFTQFCQAASTVPVDMVKYLFVEWLLTRGSPRFQSPVAHEQADETETSTITSRDTFYFWLCRAKNYGEGHLGLPETVASLFGDDPGNVSTRLDQLMADPDDSHAPAKICNPDQKPISPSCPEKAAEGVAQLGLSSRPNGWRRSAATILSSQMWPGLDSRQLTIEDIERMKIIAEYPGRSPADQGVQLIEQISNLLVRITQRNDWKDIVARMLNDGFTAPDDLERTFDSLLQIHWLLVQMVEDEGSSSG